MNKRDNSHSEGFWVWVSWAFALLQTIAGLSVSFVVVLWHPCVPMTWMIDWLGTALYKSGLKLCLVPYSILSVSYGSNAASPIMGLFYCWNIYASNMSILPKVCYVECPGATVVVCIVVFFTQFFCLFCFWMIGALCHNDSVHFWC